MVLLETPGLWLSLVIRGSIGWSRRLSCFNNTVAWHWRLLPSIEPSVSRTRRPPPRMKPQDGKRTLCQRRSSCFQLRRGTWPAKTNYFLQATSYWQHDRDGHLQVPVNRVLVDVESAKDHLSAFATQIGSYDSLERDYFQVLAIRPESRIGSTKCRAPNYEGCHNSMGFPSGSCRRAKRPTLG